MLVKESDKRSDHAMDDERMQFLEREEIFFSLVFSTAANKKISNAALQRRAQNVIDKKLAGCASAACRCSAARLD